ncbi:MAG: poly(3-hydroxyalkanoate) synthetase, partial [Hyphomicrobiales bacterium]|nr:poly(3-hydroxyalkanoate) synthetase [Hyphomicrobiales bacterium]
MAAMNEFWDLIWRTASFPASMLHEPVERPELATLDATLLDLPTMALRSRSSSPPRARGPVVIVAPFALHDASIGDFASEHSIAERFTQAGLGPLALTQWKSATPLMSGFAIDDYLRDLDRAVDALGGRAALVGLCQGGWLAAAYAALFPQKVRALVLAGAPIDLWAAPSQITRSLAHVSPAVLEGLVRMHGGRVLGHLTLPVWSLGLHHRFDACETLQRTDDDALKRRALAWNA